MRLFVYEYLTGGGWFEQPGLPAGSLLREGRAMATALAADFARVADADVSIMQDGRLEGPVPPGCKAATVSSAAEERKTFCRLAACADWTLVIAPETGGALLSRAQAALAAGGRLLSPAPACIEIAADKQLTADILSRQGIRVPPGRKFTESQREAMEMPLPLVAKPVDGCGSSGLRMIERPAELASLPRDGSLRVERFVRGLSASVAVLSGPRHDLALPACRQRLARDGRFTYLGGSLPLPGGLDERARRLAVAAVRAIGGRAGYMGVDLILGEAADGSDDHVIEINPRLTTSYVGLRAASRQNLAEAMLQVLQGREPDLEFAPGPIEFSADGQILSSRLAL